MGRLADLATAHSRSRLPERPGRQPHWRFLARGKALGYRPGKSGGSWAARFQVPGTTTYRMKTLGTADDESRSADGVTVFSFQQAQKAAMEWCEDQERAANGQEPVERDPYTVSRAMEDYLDWSRAHRKAPHQVEQVNGVHIRPSLGEIEIANLGPVRLRKWHAKIASSPPLRRTAKGEARNVGTLETPEDRRKRQSTANRALAVLKAALNMAYRDGKVASDDAWRRVKPFKGVDRPKMRFLEADEAVRLLNSCDPDFRRLVRAALLTGCRYGELCRLRVRDFKATPAPLIQLGETKSGKSRHVFLNEEGAAFFGELAAGRKDASRCSSGRTASRGGGPTRRGRMAEACEAAGIDPPASFHDLRHTYASHYLMNGGDLSGLSQQLGHADTRMTTRHYAHLADHWRAEQAWRHVPSFGGGEEALSSGRLIRFGAATVTEAADTTSEREP